MTDPPLWMPGAIRIESHRRNPLNNNGFRLLTWHTFEAAYSLTVENALRILIRNGTEAFVFHPITGQWGQCQPMDTAARTLKSSTAYPTNRFGTVHQQVEVVAYAARPWTNDLTEAGRAGLAKGLDFFRAWGIPDQWAWRNQPPPRYPGGSVLRRNPEQSGHAYHSGWPVNTHGDPGAIRAPWEIAPRSPGTVRKGDTGSLVVMVQEYLDALGYDAGKVDGVAGEMFDAAVRAFQTNNGLDVDGVAGPATLTQLRSKDAIMARLHPDDIQAIAKETTRQVWSATVGRDEHQRTLAGVLSEARSNSAAARESAAEAVAQAAAVIEAIKAANTDGLDLDAVTAAAAKGAKDALSSLEVRVKEAAPPVQPDGYVSGVRAVEDVDQITQEA